MIPYFDVIMISLCIGIISFTLGMVIFCAPRAHDYEQEYEVTCTKSRHLFPHKEGDEVFCFCGEDVLRLHDDKNFIIVKA